MGLVFIYFIKCLIPVAGAFYDVIASLKHNAIEKEELIFVFNYEYPFAHR